MVKNRNVIEYYEKGHADYFLIYFRHHNQSMNYGYWDEKITNRQDSLNRLYEHINEALNIKQTDHILDAGCGFGDASFWFAKHTGCQVTGITITPSQVRDATKLAHTYKLNKVDFQNMDYTKTSFKDNSFDHIYAIETICHLHDKTPFYHEMFRLLKPGGKLIVAEYDLKKSDQTKQERKSFKKFLSGWALGELWPTTKHRAVMKKIGFRDVQSEDYSKYTEKTAHFFYLYSLFGIPFYVLFNKLGLLINDVRLKNAYSCYYQWTTRQAGLWGHTLLSAQKTKK